MHQSFHNLSRYGAAVKNLIHSASFYSEDKVAPSNAEAKHLMRSPAALMNIAELKTFETLCGFTP